MTMASRVSGSNKVRPTLINYRRSIVIKKLRTFLHNEEGLTIVEYAVAAGLITAAVAASFVALGGAVDGMIVLVTGFI